MKQFFCAFCRTKRKANLNRHISIVHALGLFALTLAALYAVFGGWDPRSIFVYILLLCVSEIFVQLKWRIAVVCPECGFDPVMYKKNQKLACSRVKRHLKRRSSQASVILKKPLNLPTVVKRPNEAEGARHPIHGANREKPKIMSRHI